MIAYKEKAPVSSISSYDADILWDVSDFWDQNEVYDLK